MSRVENLRIKVVHNLIRGITYKSDNQEWDIPVESFCISEKDNPGGIIEHYRKQKESGAESGLIDEYLTSRREIFEKYIGRCNNPCQDKPDYIQVFWSQDTERNEILRMFYNKILERISSEEPLPDFSQYFAKIDPSKSIREGDETFEQKAGNYHYTRPTELTAIKKLWIIDDTIDTGATIKIFLDNLVHHGLLISDTTIQVFILYNLRKLDSAFSPGWTENLNALKESLRNPNSSQTH